MKKLVALVLAGATMLMTGCGSTQTAETDAYKGQTLKFYNWGEYVGENVVADFEKQYGCKVISEYFDSNEMMYTKLQAGDAYDVIVPSDYMIERMKKEDMLQPLDKDKIPNLSKLTDKMSCDFDPDHEYSVPYFWGNVGLVYNKTKVSKDEIESKGWDILQDTKYKDSIYVYDSERDAFMVAFKALGYSMNTDKDEEITAASQWLKTVNDTMGPVYVTDEVIDSMSNGAKDIAVVYSGDAAYILDQNEDMAYCQPKQGTNVWTDAMVIPKNAENPELANVLINFILEDKESLDNSQTVGYASSNQNVLNELSEGDYAENEAYVPRSGYDKDEYFHDNETLRAKLSELWIKIKAGN